MSSKENLIRSFMRIVLFMRFVYRAVIQHRMQQVSSQAIKRLQTGNSVLLTILKFSTLIETIYFRKPPYSRTMTQLAREFKTGQTVCLVEPLSLDNVVKKETLNM